MKQEFDLIVIGAGHAGIEAAYLAARQGAKTLLLSMLCEGIGVASCNPAIGGLAKGHLVKEIDALGGLMGVLADISAIGFRTLNESKGEAVQGTRAQIDMKEYPNNARIALLDQENLFFSQEMATDILVEELDCGASGASVNDDVNVSANASAKPQKRVTGVATALGNEYKASKVIVCAGTFLNGLIHVGFSQIKSGRVGELASTHLSQSLQNLGIKMGRLKTGTCPRVLGSSMDLASFEVQEPEENPRLFSARSPGLALPQLPCFVAYTNTNTHDLIRSNFYRAPMFTGQIEGLGPRYCPSVEDKVNRFAHKDSHHLFLEPQTQDAREYYINGFSTSLPYEVQLEALRSVKGFEKAVITRHGYAIEYDWALSFQIKHSLETKLIKGLYLAGQINGSTGYEEAAAQGLMASLNAILALRGEEPFILRRDEAYIGVMIDDLVSKGTKEPYRMFTSRAEYRLLLREQNAKYRLSKYAKKYDLLDVKEVEKNYAEISRLKDILLQNNLRPNKETNALLKSMGEDEITDILSWQKVLARVSFDINKLDFLLEHLGEININKEVKSELLQECKYHHYVLLQQDNIDKMKDKLKVKIPEGFSFKISGLSLEVIEKLEKSRPENLHAASLISGITPAAIDILHIYIKQTQRESEAI